MAMEYWPCYLSYRKKCEKLSDQELGRLFRALMTFSETGEAEELAGRESIAFDFISDDIRRAQEAYEAKCQTNRENAEKRYDRMPLHATAYDRMQNKTKTKGEAKTKTKPSKGEDSARARFIPPTVEEVRAYCRERGNSVDPQQFVDFYASKGWKVGNQGMKDWKAAVRTWEQRDKPAGEKPKGPAWDENTNADLDRMLRKAGLE